jgi:hypothetical protein
LRFLNVFHFEGVHFHRQWLCHLQIKIFHILFSQGQLFSPLRLVPVLSWLRLGLKNLVLILVLVTILLLWFDEVQRSLLVIWGIFILILQLLYLLYILIFFLFFIFLPHNSPL